MNISYKDPKDPILFLSFFRSSLFDIFFVNLLNMFYKLVTQRNIQRRFFYNYRVFFSLIIMIVIEMKNLNVILFILIILSKTRNVLSMESYFYC